MSQGERVSPEVSLCEDSLPPAPRFDKDLPQPVRRSSCSQREDNVRIELALQLVTPVLGGSYRLREIDQVDVVRPATVRGHLRFWWRALYGHQCKSSKELYERESELWGRAAGDAGGRSAVEILITVSDRGKLPQYIDRSDISMGDPEAYALWPARKQERDKLPPAPRFKPGLSFRLSLSVPREYEQQVRNAVRAWILFGGYGSRTRRGLGTLTVLANNAADRRSDWLPAKPTREEFKRLFGFDPFERDASVSKTDCPLLRGAALHVDSSPVDPKSAWTKALSWLREFRQGTGGGAGQRAREPGSPPQRPSISNWPEADKIRHLMGKTRGHPPKHNPTPVWPRAGFGLPIIGRFQTQSRDGRRIDEPEAFELRWCANGEEHDRLASPLIVKALPLADGKFVPCALWLYRAYPTNGKVGLVRSTKQGKVVDPKTLAPFDKLIASGDKSRFGPLERGTTLREVFLGWLKERYKTTMVAP